MFKHFFVFFLRQYNFKITSKHDIVTTMTISARVTSGPATHFVFAKYASSISKADFNFGKAAVP